MSDSRYYRASSPPRSKRSGTSERTSRAHDSYSGTSRSSTEKSSSSGVIPISTETFVTPRSSAYSGSTSSGAYGGRTRKGTLDQEGYSSSKPRAVVTHQQKVPGSSSPVRKSYDRDPVYVTSSTSNSQPKREHKRLYSVDDGGQGPAVASPTSVADPHARNFDSWGSSDRDREREKRDHPRDRDRPYHLTGSSKSSNAAPPTIDEDAFGYTDPEGMYRDTEPRWRQRRGSIDGRSRDRPVGMLDPGADYRQRGHRSSASRDTGPPLTVRGFDKIKEAPERGGSIRESRQDSRERSTREPAFLAPERAATYDLPVRPSSTRPPTDIDAPQQRLPADQRYDRRLDSYDDRDDYRDQSREPRGPERKFTDSHVGARGFGIRNGSAAYSDSSEEDYRDRRRIAYPSQSPPRGGHSRRAPSMSDFVPSHLLADTGRHHERRGSERDDYRDRGPRGGSDEHPDTRQYERSGSRRSPPRTESSGAGLAGAAGVAAAGAFAAHEIKKDRVRERRYSDEEDQDRPRHASRADPDDADDRLRRVSRPDVDDVDERPRRAPRPQDEVKDRPRRAPRPEDDVDDRSRPAPRDDLDDVEDRPRRVPRADPDDVDERPRQRRSEYNDIEPRPRDHVEDRRRGDEQEVQVREPLAIRSRERREPEHDNSKERSSNEEPRESRDTQAGAEALDPDEEYRRRVQQATAELASMEIPPSPRESEAADRDRRWRDSDLVVEPTNPPPRRSREDMSGALSPRDSEEEVKALPPAPSSGFVPPPTSLPLRDDYHEPRSGSFLGGGDFTQEPGELEPALAGAGAVAAIAAIDHSDHSDPPSNPSARSRSSSDPSRGSRGGRVHIVEPPKEEKETTPIRSILKKPTQKFPEDPNPVREGVTTIKDPKRDERARKEGIPPDARWTKIDRKWVNPQALDEAGERYEERMEHVIVLRVLTKHEIQKYADRTRQIRDERERRHSRRHGDDDDRYRPEKDDRDRDRDKDRRDRDRDRDRDDGRHDRRHRDREKEKRRAGDDYDSDEDEEYQRMKREKADLERSLRREKERPRMLEGGHDR